LQHGQQRENGAFRKIGMFKQSTGITDDGAQLEPDRLQMGIDPFATGWLQGAEQPIALRSNYWRFWHSVDAMVSVDHPWAEANGVCIKLMAPTGRLTPA